MSNYIKPTDYEIEFLNLMGVELNDAKYINTYKEKPHSRTNIVYIHLFKYKDMELLFYRKNGLPTLESLVIKRNGETIIVGEEMVEGKYPKRFVTYIEKEPKFHNAKIHVIAKPMIYGKYFFETRIFVEYGTFKQPSVAIKYEPKDAINENYQHDYEGFIKSYLESHNEASDVFIEVFNYFKHSFINALRIPIEYSDNFREALSLEEDGVNAKYDLQETQLFIERNEKLLNIRESRQALEKYIAKYSDKNENKRGGK